MLTLSTHEGRNEGGNDNRDNGKLNPNIQYYKDI